MEIFSTDGVLVLLRWLHIAAGITWIGILYYFNFVQAPSFAQFDAAARTEATRKLVPRALLWFRYAALVTWLGGLAWLIVNIASNFDNDWGAFFKSGHGTVLTAGMALGTIMLLNVWGVIWRNQKVIIASAEATAAGGQADPRAADAARRGLLASRTNVVFSIPMLFFMVSSSHYGAPGRLTGGGKSLFALVVALAAAAIELNALVGLTGATKKPLEQPKTTIWAGVALLVLFIVMLEIGIGDAEPVLPVPPLTP